MSDSFMGLSMSSLFYPDPTTANPHNTVLDQSVSVLYNIFGAPINSLLGVQDAGAQVSKADSAYGGNLLTMVLSYFNSMVLIIVAAIFIYVVAVGTVHTARDGKFLGRLDTHWTPIRLIFGPTMIFPVKGFSLIQMLVMWIILVGVNIADHVWQYAVNQINVQPPTSMPSAVTNTVAKEIGTVFVYKAVQTIVRNFAANAQLKFCSDPSDNMCKTTDGLGIIVPVTGGYVDIFGSEANNYLKAVHNLCAKATKYGYVSMCMNAANILFSSQGKSVFYPVAPIPLPNQNDTSESDMTFTNLYMGLHQVAGQPADSGGSYGGNYEIFTQGSLGSRIEEIMVGGTIPPGAKVISNPNKWPQKVLLPPSASPACPSGGSPSSSIAKDESMTTDFIACKLAPIVSDTVIDGTKIASSSNISEFAQEADFSGLVSAIVNHLKAVEAANEGITNKNGKPIGPNLLLQGVPGTGTTCGATGAEQCKTSAGAVIPAIPFASSWWYASDVYLVLNQKMAQNINDLAKMVKKFQLDGSSVELGKLVGTACADGSKPPPGKSCFTPTIHLDIAAVKYQLPFTTYDSKGKLVVNPKAKSPISSVLPVFTPQQVPHSADQMANIQPSVSAVSIPNNIMLQSWDDAICIYRPTFNVVKGVTQTCQVMKQKESKLGSESATISATQDLQVKDNPTGDAKFYATLQNMPKAYQVPIGLLLYIAQQQDVASKFYGTSSATQIAAVTKQLIENIIAVLMANHIYPGSQTQPFNVNTDGEISPVQRLAQMISNKVIGARLPGNYSPFQGKENQLQDASGAMSQIFYEVYQLGNETPTNLTEAINASFNNIATAQRIGLSMISVVLNSAAEVSSFLENTMQGFISSDKSSAKKIEITGIAGAAAAAALGAAGGVTGSTALETAGVLAETGTQIAVMVQQISLQEKIVDQNYDMMMDLMWLPIGIAFATLLFGAGISFALIVPLTPYIIFWAGQVAWLLGVIEAMIAAPLLALAITHPGGHETWGHSIPGWKMLIGVVLRPVLMVLGLVTGLILTFVVIKFSSQGFQIISNQILSYAGNAGDYSSGPSPYSAAAAQLIGHNSTIVQGLLACMMLFLFCGFMVMAFNKCFSTIYLFPEKVVQWIGGQAAQAGKEEAQQMSSQASQTGSQLGQAGGQSMSQQGQADSSFAKGSGDVASSSAGQIASTSSSAGKNVSGAGKAIGKKMRESKGGKDGGGLDSE